MGKFVGFPEHSGCRGPPCDSDNYQQSKKCSSLGHFLCPAAARKAPNGFFASVHPRGTHGGTPAGRSRTTRNGFLPFFLTHFEPLCILQATATA
jgi:hypothetical protein